MSPAADELVSLAGRLANEGRWREAEEAWRKLHHLEPANPKALFGLGIHALQRGEVADSVAWLSAACEASPLDKLAWLTLAKACEQQADAQGELAAIERALSVDAYYLPGLLAKGAYLERRGARHAAAFVYSNALKIAPPEDHTPDYLRAHLDHAKAVAAKHSSEFAAYLEEKLRPSLIGLEPPDVERWRESASIMTGATKPYPSLCNQLHVPRLPAIPFFDAAQFPWARALEAKTEAIRAELIGAIEESRERFVPYIAYAPADPVNQWRELNHSDRWSAYKLWSGGDPVAEAQARCPETTKALAIADMAEIGGLCPNAMFSALAPRTHIPPHTGETNARLVAHLPLVVPDNCTFRVGFERRKWEVGKLLVFDDTIEHEARNDSDELRVVLIFDLWNPLLSRQEREIARAMTAAARSFSVQ